MQGNIHEGARPLPWQLYLDFNSRFYELGTAQGIAGAVFSKLTVNLACRGDNTKQLCVGHIQPAGDSFAIPFAHEKTNQKGGNAAKLLPRPRHCYGNNPLDFSVDLCLSIFTTISSVHSTGCDCQCKCQCAIEGGR